MMRDGAGAERGPKDLRGEFRDLLKTIFSESGKKGDEEWLSGIDIGGGKTMELSFDPTDAQGEEPIGSVMIREPGEGMDKITIYLLDANGKVEKYLHAVQPGQEIGTTDLLGSLMSERQQEETKMSETDDEDMEKINKVLRKILEARSWE